MLSLGTYPDVARKAARARRDESSQSLAAGIDPSDARKAAQAASAGRAEAKTLAGAGKPGAGTFEHVARDGLATVQEAKVSEGHAERNRIRFEQDASHGSAGPRSPTSRRPSCWTACGESRPAARSKPRIGSKTPRRSEARGRVAARDGRLGRPPCHPRVTGWGLALPGSLALYPSIADHVRRDRR